MTDLGFQKQHFFSAKFGSPGWSILHQAVRKLSSGSNELLRESRLVELVEGAPWQSYTNSILSLSCSLFRVSLFHLPSCAFCSRVLSVLLSSCSRSLPFLSFSISIDLPLRENMVLIRHFAEPVFLGQTLLKTPQIHCELLFKPCLYISGVRCDFKLKLVTSYLTLWRLPCP